MQYVQKLCLAAVTALLSAVGQIELDTQTILWFLKPERRPLLSCNSMGVTCDVGDVLDGVVEPT
jgi:hypothetical protein